MDLTHAETVPPDRADAAASAGAARQDTPLSGGPGGLGSGAADNRFPCFDGLRAIAALLVVGVHTAFASGFDSSSGLRRYTSRLEIGVAVFFVISGFLLYRPFAVEHFGGRSALKPRAFWVRRLKRIIPAYWAAFLVITYVLHADTVRHAWYSPLVYLGFGQIYSPSYVLSGLGQAWSLCVEMSFYLLLPLYAALLIRKRRSADRRLKTELAGILALVAISVVFRVIVLSFNGPYPSTMPNWLPGYLDQFAFGMILAVASAWLAAGGRRPAWLWHPLLPWVSWALAALTFVAVSNIGLSWQPIAAQTAASNLERQTLYGLFAFFVVLPAVFGPQNETLVRRLLRIRPLVLIGIVSYGVYLWHEAWMYKFFSWTGDHLFSVPLWELTLAVTFGAVASAALSYVCVERPVLRWKGWRRSPARALPARRGAVTPARPAAADVSTAGVGS